MSDEGMKKGWLVNWLITEKETVLGGSCDQLRILAMIIGVIGLLP